MRWDRSTRQRIRCGSAGGKIVQRYDANALLYAINTDCSEHTPCRAVVVGVLTRPDEWVSAEQVWFELYRLLRHPPVLQRPLNVVTAAETVMWFGDRSGWTTCAWSPADMGVPERGVVGADLPGPAKVRRGSRGHAAGQGGDAHSHAQHPRRFGGRIRPADCPASWREPAGLTLPHVTRSASPVHGESLRQPAMIRTRTTSFACTSGALATVPSSGWSAWR